MRNWEITGSRRPRGERHPRSKCTDHDVALAIALVVQHGVCIAEVARKFDVSRSAGSRWLSRGRRALGAR